MLTNAIILNSKTREKKFQEKLTSSGPETVCDLKEKKKKEKKSGAKEFSTISATTEKKAVKFDFRGHTKELVRLLAEKKVRFTPRIRFSMAHELSSIKPHLCE